MPSWIPMILVTKQIRGTTATWKKTLDRILHCNEEWRRQESCYNRKNTTKKGGELFFDLIRCVISPLRYNAKEILIEFGQFDESSSHVRITIYGLGLHLENGRFIEKTLVINAADMQINCQIQVLLIGIE